MKGNRKEERSVAPFYDTFFWDSSTPRKNRLIAVKPGSLRQNGVALPLAPPPLPLIPLCSSPILSKL